MHSTMFTVSFSLLQNINATFITISGLPSLPAGRIPLLPSSKTPYSSQTVTSNCSSSPIGIGLSQLNCNDIWDTKQDWHNDVLLSAVLDIYVQCSEDFMESNTTSDLGILSASFLASLQQINSFIPSPCIQKRNCHGEYCAAIIDLDVLDEARESLQEASASLAVVLNCSSSKSNITRLTRGYTLLQVRSTSQYAVSYADGASSNVIVSGATAPDIVDGEYSISFSILVNNPSSAQAAPTVTVIGASGVIQEIGVRVSRSTQSIPSTIVILRILIHFIIAVPY